MKSEVLFEVDTPLGFNVRTTQAYWKIITEIKHPVMKGRESDVKAALKTPNEVRRSRSDANVHLFYRTRGPGQWTCVVAKRLHKGGFIVTAYPTDTIKEGEQVWKK